METTSIIAILKSNKTYNEYDDHAAVKDFASEKMLLSVRLTKREREK